MDTWGVVSNNRKNVDVAQMVERVAEDHGVGSSILSVHIILLKGVVHHESTTLQRILNRF